MADVAAPPTLSIVVPCFNEEFNIPELVDRVLLMLERGNLTGELLLVDDGSKDRTRQVIEEHERSHPGQVVGCYHVVNQGIAAAWKTGTARARGRYVVIIDADLQYQPEDIIRLHRTLIETSVDVVQGWRSAMGRERDRRYYLSRGLNSILNRSFGTNLRDSKSGFVICAREVMQDLLAYEGDYYYWQSFIMVAAHAKGYSYQEVETLFENRHQGISFLETQAYRASAKVMVDVGKALWEYRVRRAVPDPMTQFLRHRPVIDRNPRRSAVREMEWRAYLATFDRTHWMITRDVEHYYDTLNRTQWLSLAEMRELQDEKLRRLVRHAYRNVPYYRTRMKERGLKPEDIRGQDDLRQLPLLAKDDIRRHLHFDILSEDHDKSQVFRVSTTGSTGEPLVAYADRTRLEFAWAAALRSQEWTGYRFGDRCARLCHPAAGRTATQAARELADAALARRKLVPVHELRDGTLADTVRQLSAWEPALLEGHAEALDLLAQYIRGHGGLEGRPRAVMSSAQTLPAPSRRIIEEAFGCRVFDKYGSREFSAIACECEAHAGHHVVAEGYIVEILREGRPAAPGETGEVVITDLNNYCMPFIRYRIGDRAEALDSSQPCSCGRGLPRIGDIVGRPQAIIQGTGGRYVLGSFFGHLLSDYGFAFRQCQVAQVRHGAVVLRVLKGSRYSDDVLDEVVRACHRHLGADMQIEVQLVESLGTAGASPAVDARLSLDFTARGRDG